MFTIYKTPEREVFADYSKEVVIPQIISLFVKRDSPIEYTGDLSQLKHHHFGVVSKVSYGKKFDKAIENNLFTHIEETATGELNMKMFLKNRFDILISNKYGALFILKTLNKMDAVRELQPEVEKVPSYIAFSKKRNLTAVRDEFDMTLKQLKDEGAYEKLINSFFQ